MNVLFSLIQSVLGLSISVAVWTALYAGAHSVQSSVGSISLKEMVTYAVVSAILSKIVYFGTIWQVGSKIHDGSIATELIKPYNFGLATFSQQMGNNSFEVLFEIPPLVIFGYFVFGFSTPDPQYILPFIGSGILAVIIGFMTTYCCSLFAFWYTISWHIGSFYFVTSRLMSGIFVPLWFFPEGLLKIADLLPFKLMFYVPISIYLGKIKLEEAWGLVLQQGIWIVILFILTKIVWEISKKKLVVQGG